MPDIKSVKPVFELTFSDILEELKKDKKKIFQPERAKDGIALVCDESGFLMIEEYKEGKVTTSKINFIINVSHIGTARYREVFNKNQLFEAR